jgi:hypothetical protein
MNPNPQRNSNPIVCCTLIALGILCLLGTILTALYLKNGIIERVRETPSVEGIGDVSRIGTIDQEIQSKDREIEFAGKMPDWDKDFEDARKKLGLKPAANSANSNFEQDKANKIKKIEEEKRQLIVKKDELAGKIRARQMRPRSWEEWADANGIELLLGVIPLGFLSLYFLGVIFGAKLPARNPLSLTGLERKCILFLPFAIVFSAFGFFLFVWILALIY